VFVRRSAIHLSLLIVAACGGNSKPTPMPATAPAEPVAEVTRAELEARRASLPAGSPEAKLIEARLRDGDFNVGDRIWLHVLEDSALTDTFPVRAGRILQLPVVQEIPLTGVLRSELDAYLQERIGRILRNPTVDAEPLMRLAVLGGVQSPGYYNVPADLLLSDLVMVAGGPVGEVRLDKSKIKRFGEEIVDKESVRYALDAGMTLDRLNLAGGDEVAIGYDKLGRMERAARTVLLILSIPLAIAALGSL
jgi:protein involved in polysaccharide export with SLBB domain